MISQFLVKVLNIILDCNLGDTVLSGSYILSNAADATSVSDFALATQDGWATLATGTVFAAVQTIAQCFANP
jgi:hypothetical protein